MARTIVLSLEPKVAFTTQLLEKAVLNKSGIAHGQIRLLKRSIDARKAPVKIRVEAQVFYPDEPVTEMRYQLSDNRVDKAPQVLIVGAGPAGLFAAIRLIEAGLKPVIIERGKDVQSRRRDLAAINKHHIVHPDSNYCFGEGGAGTYSDGKLYTRASKRGNVQRILQILVAFGARSEILIDAHPHIGTNKLPKLIAQMRAYILERGGEIYFEHRVDDLLMSNGSITGVKADGQVFKGKAVILATGHSARDIYQLLHRKKIELEAKPFALGVRVEHPQALIDSIQYHCKVRNTHLPAASYSLVQQVPVHDVSRGVFSFCMCPGGFIVPAATAPGEIVVNGMSPSRRDSRFANSGIVVGVETADVAAFNEQGALAGMYYQQQVEQAAFATTGSQAAPAQRLTDFVAGKVSNQLPETSYQPGVVAADLSEILPSQIALRLQEAFKKFDKKMKGYLTNEAIMLGVESRTSSPVRIPRNKETLEHTQITGLYPAGEGAGYAGGIVSAAMDGENCASMICKKYGLQYENK